MRNTIYSINTALKMFILSICLLNFTACSAKAKTHDTEEKTRTIRHSDSTIDANTDTTLKSASERTTVQSEIEIRNSFKSQDSVKATSMRNNKAVKKRELIIDSIISSEGKIFGLRAYERSSDVGNEDSETKWYGSFDSNETSNNSDRTSNEMLNADFTHNNQIKAKLTKDEDSSDLSRVRRSIETKGWFLFIITGLISSWWFWIVVVLVTFFTWCYLRRINPITAIKTLFNKFRINGNENSE